VVQCLAGPGEKRAKNLDGRQPADNFLKFGVPSGDDQAHTADQTTPVLMVHNLTNPVAGAGSQPGQSFR